MPKKRPLASESAITLRSTVTWVSGCCSDGARETMATAKKATVGDRDHEGKRQAHDRDARGHPDTVRGA